ncbi:MAG: branched-chain amino acid ABC transporter permease [Burkholderiaceae bacterium]|jgi:branched-chain amino acid transport system permease protein|nr:branched-chain amino acid ABC transporter permease [Burkholderiaceae bacterium]
MQGILAALLNSLEIGLLLFVIAVGLNIVFGVLNVINFAHGGLYMLGAYFTYSVVAYLGLPFWPALALAPLAVAVIAVLIERVVLRQVYGRDVSDSLLVTFALLLVIDDAVRVAWGSGIHVVAPPPSLRGTIDVLGITYPVYSFFVMGAALVAMFALWLFFVRTRAGRIVRAAAIDRRMAEGIGIDVPRVITGVFALGAWMAGAAGVIAAPIRAIAPGMGDRVIIDAFIVVVIGGLGSFPGTLLGALVLGLIYGFGGRYLPQVNLVLPYLGMALVLLLRPRGLMGKGAA